MDQSTPPSPYEYNYTPENLQATMPVTSRRLKREQSQILRQTILFGAGGLALILIGIFVIIPGVIRIVGGLAGNNPQVVEADVPPQVPVLAAPLDATSSAKLNVTGFTENNAKVTLVLNGSPQKEITADDSGNFSADVELSQGENHIAAYAKRDTAESALSGEYVIIFDDQAPSIEIESPKEGENIQGKKNQNIQVKGKTEAGSKMYVNDRLGFVQDDGTFSVSFYLNPGENVLKIKVVDMAENITEKELKVTFTE